MNKYILLSLIWFVLGIYALIFREANNDLPPFPHFNKVAHFGLFFVQIWLLAKAFIKSRTAIPYFALISVALLYALASELGQAYFTETREGSWLDGLADMCGAICALLFIKFCTNKKTI